MRRVLFLLLSIVTIMFLSAICSVAQRQRQSILSLDAQAEREARAFWNSRITPCGTDYYTQERMYIHQFRNPRIEVRLSSISAADKMNGIEYIGITNYYAAQSRTYSPKLTLYQDPGWSKWSEGFTAAMGGVGLMGEVRKEHGRWTVTPSSFSQAGQLKPISCSDALNPANYVRAINTERESAEVREFRRIATSGSLCRLYSNNLPATMWDALTRYGLNHSTENYILLRDVYLAPTGGWSVWREWSTGTWGDFPPEIDQKVRAGYNVETISPSGGWFMWETQYQSRQRTGEYLTKDLPSWLQSKIDEIHHNPDLKIERVRLGPNGQGVIFYNSVYGGGQRWYAVGAISDALMRLWNGGEVNGSDKTIDEVAFSPNGGYVIIYSHNAFITNAVPDTVKSALSENNRCGFSIDRVSFGPDDSWVVLSSAFTPIQCPPLPANSNGDISGTYGIVGNAIFNKKTLVVFVTPEEFFHDSGKSSFDGLTYDRLSSLPTGLRFVNGRTLTPEDYRRLQPKMCTNFPTVTQETARGRPGWRVDENGVCWPPPKL